MLNYIWDYLTKDLRFALKDYKSKVNTLENTIKDLNLNISDLNNANLKLDIIITDLKSTLKREETAVTEETYWRSKWSRNPIRYKAQGEYYRDVRGLINYPSYIADEVVLFNGLKKDTEEETILNLIKWVHKNIKYVSDSTQWNVNEYWEDSDITMQTKCGDCENLSLVLKSLSLVCGIPDYKVKILAGDVVNPADKTKTVGHAFPVFLFKDKWRIIDPTYYPDWNTPIKDRMDASKDSRYKTIWFGFTKQDNFSQKKIDL